MSSVLAETGLPLASDELQTSAPLIVAWQHPTSRRISAVGLIDHDHDGYRFRYVCGACDVTGFRPFLGFADLTRSYRSEWLFPMFAQRVMNPRRPDYPYWVHVLDLGAEPTPFEFLARTQGRREGDSVLVLSPPQVEEGAVRFEFLVHGVSHVAAGTSAAVLSELRQGDVVSVRAEPENPQDPLALFVCSAETPVGWVPRLLCPAVTEALEYAELSGRVIRINGPEVPPHLRLLVEFTGFVPDGWNFFAAESWMPLSG